MIYQKQRFRTVLIVRLLPASRSQLYEHRRGTSALNGAKQIRSIEETLEMEYVNGFQPLGFFGRPRLHLLDLRPVGWASSGCWHHGR